MDIEKFFNKEELSELNEIQEDIQKAKKMIDGCIKNDLGVSFCCDVEKNHFITLDFAKSYNTLPFFVDLLRRLYDRKTNLFKNVFKRNGFKIIDDK